MISRRRCCCSGGGGPGSCSCTFQTCACGGSDTLGNNFACSSLAGATLSIDDHESGTFLASGTFSVVGDVDQVLLSWSGGRRDKPDPTTAATVAVTAVAGSLQPGTYRMAYTWDDPYGETTAGSSGSAAFTVPDASHRATGTIPSLPVGVTSASLYLTDGSPGTEIRVASGVTATSTVLGAFPALATPIPPSNTSALANPSVQATVSTVSGAGGLDGGNYYISYTWNDAFGSTTEGTSLSAIFGVSDSSEVATVHLPTFPGGATGADLYLYQDDTGSPVLQGRIAQGVVAQDTRITADLVAAADFATPPGSNTSHLSNPTTQATVAVTSGGGGLQAGTFRLSYTFTDGSGGETTGGASESATFTRASDSDVSTAALPALPAGAAAMSVYLTDGGPGTGRSYLRGVTGTSLDLTDLLLDAGTPVPATNTTFPVVDFTVDPHDARLLTSTGSATVACDGRTIALPGLSPASGYHCMAGCGSPLQETLHATLSGGGSYTLTWNGFFWVGPAPSGPLRLYESGIAYEGCFSGGGEVSGLLTPSSCPPSFLATIAFPETPLGGSPPDCGAQTWTVTE